MDWPETIPYVLRGLNNSKNKATKFAPFFSLYGRSPRSLAPISNLNVPATIEGYNFVNRSNLEQVHKLIKICQEEADQKLSAKDKQKTSPMLIPGDEVCLYRPVSSQAKTTNLPFIGPFSVVKSNEQVVKIIDSTGKMDWVSRNHVVKKIPRKPELILVPPPFYPKPHTIENIEIPVPNAFENNEPSVNNENPARVEIDNNPEPVQQHQKRKWSKRPQYQPQIRTTRSGRISKPPEKLTFLQK